MTQQCFYSAFSGFPVMDMSNHHSIHLEYDLRWRHFEIGSSLTDDICFRLYHLLCLNSNWMSRVVSSWLQSCY